MQLQLLEREWRNFHIFNLKESQYYIKDPYRYPGYCRLERVGRGMR